MTTVALTLVVLGLLAGWRALALLARPEPLGWRYRLWAYCAALLIVGSLTVFLLGLSGCSTPAKPEPTPIPWNPPGDDSVADSGYPDPRPPGGP